MQFLLIQIIAFPFGSGLLLMSPPWAFVMLALYYLTGKQEYKSKSGLMT